MSHVATVDVEITNLDDLAAACKRIGLELVRGQETYHWYRDATDEELSDTSSAENFGKCEHAIRVPLDHPYQQREPIVIGNRVISTKPYEIGVVHRSDGQPGFLLKCDFWAGGRGLTEFVGADRKMPLLKQAYALSATLRVAKQRGFSIQEKRLENGSVQMFLTK